MLVVSSITSTSIGTCNNTSVFVMMYLYELFVTRDEFVIHTASIDKRISSRLGLPLIMQLSRSIIKIAAASADKPVVRWDADDGR